VKEREVVITGMGLITPLGKGVGENWENMKAMKTGIDRYPQDKVPEFLQYMGKVRELDADGSFPHKLSGQMKFLNRGSLLGVVAAREALHESQIILTDLRPSRRALYIASGDTTQVGYDFLYPSIKDGTHGKWQQMDFELLNRSTLDKANPFFLLQSINNNLFSFLSALLEFMGPNTSLASHSPCGGNALELACRSIRQGKADIAMAVGCGNWITEIPLYEMEELAILSQCRNGIHSFRPFDRRRDGFIPGEGGAAIFLEASEIAQQRGANIQATVKGFGNGIEFSDDRGLSVPAKVTARAILSAMEDSMTDLSDLAFICSHGSGSQKGDRSEMRSVSEILNTHNVDIPICGMKSYTGHLGAASDIAEVIFGVKAVTNKILPGTLNFAATEKEFVNLKISGAHQRTEKEHFLSVSYGFCGQSSSVVVDVGR
jgi:3-oxoacyl-[acyl-carrier-protein] synthase II